MQYFDWEPLWLSAKLASTTTLILGVLGLLLVYAIFFYGGKLKPIWKALVSLPLVLPPSVMGFYLLVAFRPDSWLGQLAENTLGLRLVFSFPGLVIGAVIFSLPFMVNPVYAALEGLPQTYQKAAFTLGKSKWVTYVKVLLPNIRSSVLVGLVMTFAHAIGEFGVVLMIGGNIPEETRVASIAIYNEVELLNYDNASMYALIMLFFSFVVLSVVFFFEKRR